MSEVSHVTVHDLKIREQYVPMILDKSMTYQIRNGDRGFQSGHQIRFKVVDVNGEDSIGRDFSYCTQEEVASIESKPYTVDGVMTFPWLKDGYVAFSISPSRKSTTSR